MSGRLRRIEFSGIARVARPARLMAALALACNGVAAGAADTPAPAPAPGPAAVTFQYDRIYADARNVSHFGKGEIGLPLQYDKLSERPFALHALQNSSTPALLYMAKGRYEDWHPAPYRMLAFIIQGVIESQVESGEIRRFGPGSVVLLENLTGKGHTTRILADEDCYVLVIPMPAGN